jgi:hypothetical protein
MPEHKMVVPGHNWIMAEHVLALAGHEMETHDRDFILSY